MLRHRQARRMTWLDQDDVTSVLAVFEPARLLEVLAARSPETEGKAAI